MAGSVTPKQPERATRDVESQRQPLFLDDATSAIDRGLADALNQLVRAEFPESIVDNVAHRSTVEVHHPDCAGPGGRWRLILIQVVNRDGVIAV